MNDFRKVFVPVIITRETVNHSYVYDNENDIIRAFLLNFYSRQKFDKLALKFLACLICTEVAFLLPTAALGSYPFSA